MSILVVNYHSGEPLRALLRSLDEFPPQTTFELLVADNAGDDGVAEWLMREYPDVQVVAMDRNRGYAAGINALLEVARGDFLLVLNPDVELSAGGVDHCLAYMRANPLVGVASGELFNADGTPQHNGRRFYSLLTLLLRRTPLGKLFPKHPEFGRHLMLDRKSDEAGPVDWLLGAFMLARREAVEAVGPMDERFFLYFEDVDWCYRMWEGGWEVHLLPQARFRHAHQRTSARVGRTMIHHLRSLLGFADKWGGLIWIARRMHGAWRAGVAALGDLLALNLAFLLAFLCRRLLDSFFPAPLFDLVDYLPLILFTNVVSLVALPLLGRYDGGEASGFFQRLMVAVKAAFVVSLVTMAGTWLSHDLTFSRAVLLLLVPIYMISLEFFAWLGRRLLGEDNSGRGHARILLVGSPEGVAELASHLGPRPSGDFVAGCALAQGSVASLRNLGDPWELEEICERFHIDRILVDGRGSASPRLVASLRASAAGGREVMVDQPWLAVAAGRDGVERHGRRWWPASAPRALSGGWPRSLLGMVTGLFLVLLALPGAVLCLVFALPLRLVELRPELRRGRHDRLLRWPEWHDRRSGRKLPGFVQLPRYVQLLRGRLAAAGPLPLPENIPTAPSVWLRRELAPGLSGPWSGRRALGEQQLAELERDYLDRWTASLDIDFFIRALPGLLWSREPWPELSASPREEANA